MTARELIERAARLVGVISTGESLTADEASDGLVSLNDMLASWSTEGLLIYENPREEFSFIAGQQAYTMGVGGNFNTARPQIIDSVGIIQQPSSPQLEMPIPIWNIQQWAGQSSKNLQNAYPQAVFVDYKADNVTLHFYPIPNVANKVAIYSRKPLTSVSSLSATVNLPPGYLRSLRYNLAVEFGEEYGKQATSTVQNTANELKAQLMRMNQRPVLLVSDAGYLSGQAGRYWNYRTGDYGP